MQMLAHNSHGAAQLELQSYRGVAEEEAEVGLEPVVGWFEKLMGV